jgi:TatD DNase family protein
VHDAPDPALLLERARRAGVGRVVCAGTDAPSSRRALEVARRHGPGVWATVGLHPHHASQGASSVQALARSLAGDPLVVAVGECGLDYHYDHSPRPDQRRAFAAHIELANELGLALVVHSREAWEDTFALLESHGPPPRTVLHCFSGGPVEARRALELGAFLSFSGIVTFKGAGQVQEAARCCPPERLLVETDSPYLAPVPHRGRTNEPALLPHTGSFLASLLGVAEAELAVSSARAAEEAFGL